MSALNNRILIVDDGKSVAEQICATLFRQPRNTQCLDHAAKALFGAAQAAPNSSGNRLVFDIDVAGNGDAAVTLVQTAVTTGNPYAALFCDMRTPGLKTVSQIRAVDAHIEVVVLSAYADYAIEDIVDKLGANISLMTKPFSGSDLCQMATRCVLEWNKAREMEAFVDQLSQLSGAFDDHSILSYLGEHLHDLLGVGSLAIFEQSVSGGYHFKFGMGSLAHAVAASEALGAFPQAGPTLDVQHKAEATIGSWGNDLEDKSFEDRGFECKGSEGNGFKGSGSEDNSFNQIGFEQIALPDYGLILIPALSKPLSPEKRHLCAALIEHTLVALKNLALKKTLHEKQRMAEIGRTTSHICHDIRMPILLTETLVQQLANGNAEQPTKLILDKILKSLKQADYMANDILLFSSSQLSIEPRPCRISSFIKENQDYWAHVAGQLSVHFRIESSTDFKATFDRHRMARVVSNLIKNAVEAAQMVDDPNVLLRINQAEDRFLFTIIDNGPGIPPAVKNKLFTPFSCTTKGYGHGFGLAIAQQIVSLHHGEIKLLSEPGCTRCILDLPMAQIVPSETFRPKGLSEQPLPKKFRGM